MQTQLKLMTSDFYIMHSKQVIVYAAQGYSAPVLKAGHLVSCLCVRVRVCGGGCLFVGGGGGGGGGGGALGFFLRYTHVHKRQDTSFNACETTLPGFANVPSLRDSRYLTL